VADGMGGLQKGAQAAQLVIDTAKKAFTKRRISNPELFLESICYQAHKSINTLEQDASPDPVTTCVLLYIDKNEAYWMHIGDSRLYHFRKRKLINQTLDHSAMQLMIAQGLVEKNSNAANSLQNQLYKRLGGDKAPEPDFNSSTLENGDIFLLCSDGFWQSISHEQILNILKDHPIDQDGPEKLVNLALQNGGTDCDNISITVGQKMEKPQNTVSGFCRFWGQNI
jgi:serine/threonine protein phosphatase PrpC